MRDRIQHIKHVSRAAAGEVYSTTVEPGGEQKSPPQYDELYDVLHEVERVYTWVRDIELCTQLVRRLHTDPTYHTSSQLQEQVECAVTRARGTGLKVCGALRQLQARACAVCGRHDVTARVTRLHAACARTQYSEALARHTHAIQLLHDNKLHILQQQILLTRGAASSEECLSLVEEEGTALFAGGREEEEARRALREAEVRRDELVRAEAALRDVRDLFVQLAHIVAAQQEHIDSVEYFAREATDHVGLGQEHLLRGTVSHTKARKKKLGLVVCLVVGVGVVLLVLVLT